MAHSPETRAKLSASRRRFFADPVRSAALRAANSRSLTARNNDPEFIRRREAKRAISAWCPDAYRSNYVYLSRLLGAVAAKAAILEAVAKGIPPRTPRSTK